ncbi:cytochrome b N-terminal domain-containing protein [Desulfolithobacter sp.]
MRTITPPVLLRLLAGLTRPGLSWLVDLPWGSMSLISLYVSVLSGIVLSLQYDVSEPFYSTATLELIIPFGSFWRALHYFSSQAFFLLLACHFAAILANHRETSFNRSDWVRLTLSLPVAILLLFTGYILRGDATGMAAGAIGEHIALAVPGLGPLINNLLFALSTGGFKRVYANHLIGLMVLGGWCVWPHLRRYRARWRDHAGLTLILLAMSTLLAAPMEPERFGMLHIAGPWFFLGLQEILRYIPPFWAGVVVPSSLVVLLLCIPLQERDKNKNKNKKSLYLRGILLWLAVYAVLTVRCYLWVKG